MEIGSYLDKKDKTKLKKLVNVLFSLEDTEARNLMIELCAGTSSYNCSKIMDELTEMINYKKKELTNFTKHMKNIVKLREDQDTGITDRTDTRVQKMENRKVKKIQEKEYRKPLGSIKSPESKRKKLSRRKSPKSKRKSLEFPSPEYLRLLPPSVSPSSSSKRKRSYGYTHDDYGKLYGVHYSDGMLLANDAFAWEGNPLSRALNAGS